MMGGMRALYGTPGPQVALPAASPAPPVMAAVVDYDDEDDGDAAPQLPARQPPPKRESSPRQQSSSGGVWPWAAKKEGDPEKGDDLLNVGGEHLERLISYYEKNPGKPEWQAKNAALCDEARAIIASRSGSEPAHAPVGDGYDSRGDDPDNF
jgi:hypothetical protein